MTFAGWANHLRGLGGVLIDANVLIDVVTNGGAWQAWSQDALDFCAEHTNLILNPIVYAEVSVAYKTVEDVDAAFPEELFRRDSLPWEAAFLAGKSFADYRRRGGVRRSPLSDFYIGAHAAADGLGLLTRDAARYRTYFPRVPLFAPPQS